MRRCFARDFRPRDLNVRLRPALGLFGTATGGRGPTTCPGWRSSPKQPRFTHRPPLRATAYDRMKVGVTRYSAAKDLTRSRSGPEAHESPRRVGRYRNFGEATASNYDAVVVPGGAWNPDSLRADPKAREFSCEGPQRGKPLFAICHGPPVLVNAGVLRGAGLRAFDYSDRS